MINRDYEPQLAPEDRPERDDVIERDEIIGMVIDLETMTPERFFNNYFSDRIHKRP
jgi:hypothetical protein